MMLLNHRNKYVRRLAAFSPVVFVLIASLVASPVFAGECPIIGTCG